MKRLLYLGMILLAVAALAQRPPRVVPESDEPVDGVSQCDPTTDEKLMILEKNTTYYCDGSVDPPVWEAAPGAGYAASSDLSDDLSDETGSGLSVFNIGPVFELTGTNFITFDDDEPGFTTDKVEVYMTTEDDGDGEGGNDDFTGLIFDSVIAQSGYGFGMWDTNNTSVWPSVDFINTSQGIVGILDPGFPQLALHYSGPVYTIFQTDASGDLTINPSGGDVKLVGGDDFTAGEITANDALTVTGPTSLTGTLTIGGSGHEVTGGVEFHDAIATQSPGSGVQLTRGDTADSGMWTVGQSRNQIAFAGQDPDVTIDCVTGTTTPAISNCSKALDGTGYASISNVGLDNGDVAYITITDDDGFEAFNLFDQTPGTIIIRSFVGVTYRSASSYSVPDLLTVELKYTNSDGLGCDSSACPWDTDAQRSEGLDNGVHYVGIDFDNPVIGNPGKVYGIRLKFWDWQNTTSDAYIGNIVFGNYGEYPITESILRYDPDNRFPMFDDIEWKDADGNEYGFGWDGSKFHADGDLEFGPAADQDVTLTFDLNLDADETLKWDEASDRFEFSEDLYVASTTTNLSVTTDELIVLDDTSGDISLKYDPTFPPRYDMVTDASSPYPFNLGIKNVQYLRFDPVSQNSIFLKGFNATSGGAFAGTVNFNTSGTVVLSGTTRLDDSGGEGDLDNEGTIYASSGGMLAFLKQTGISANGTTHAAATQLTCQYCRVETADGSNDGVKMPECTGANNRGGMQVTITNDDATTLNVWSYDSNGNMGDGNGNPITLVTQYNLSCHCYDSDDWSCTMSPVRAL